MSSAKPLFSTQEGAAAYFKCASFHPALPADSDSYVDSTGKLSSQKDWSDRRTNILRAAFEKMANSKSFANHRTINNFLNAYADKHPDVYNKRRTASQVRQDFEKVFGRSPKEDFLRLSFTDFLSCYQRLSGDQTDDEFVYEIECLFQIKEEWYGSGSLLASDEDMYVASFLRALKEKGRQKSDKENAIVHVLRNAFRLNDDNGARLLTLRQWSNALVALGFQLRDAESAGLFNRFKNKDSELVNYEQVVKLMFPTATQL